jgi:disulfide bond formation protein DsbB
MTPRRIGLAAALVAALVLGSALVSEYWGGLVPCPLCLWERHPYRAAIALGLAAAVLPPRFARPILWLLVLAMLTGVALGVTHVGVEWKFWPSPLPQCGGPDLSGLSIAERLARMPAIPNKPCDEPTYLIPFLPVSMAMMNLLASLAIAAGTGFCLRRSKP